MTNPDSDFIKFFIKIARLISIYTYLIFEIALIEVLYEFMLYE